MLSREQRLITRKEKGGEVRFVLDLDAITDPSKRAVLSQVQSAIEFAAAKGHRISKLVVTGAGHVLYVWRNRALFLGNAPEGGARDSLLGDQANGS